MISKHIVKTSDYYSWLIASVNTIEQSLKDITDNPAAINPDTFGIEEMIKARAYLARLKDEYFRVEYLSIRQITDIEIPVEFAYLFYKTVVTNLKSKLYAQ